MLIIAKLIPFHLDLNFYLNKELSSRWCYFIHNNLCRYRNQTMMGACLLHLLSQIENHSRILRTVSLAIYHRIQDKLLFHYFSEVSQKLSHTFYIYIHIKAYFLSPIKTVK